jgi:hypothetical protein
VKAGCADQEKNQEFPPVPHALRLRQFFCPSSPERGKDKPGDGSKEESGFEPVGFDLSQEIGDRKDEAKGKADHR